MLTFSPVAIFMSRVDPVTAGTSQQLGGFFDAERRHDVGRVAVGQRRETSGDGAWSDLRAPRNTAGKFGAVLGAADRVV